ncbi:hypothetical protein RF11_08336 [Thelohanellus kitauei]|uniref:Uncharacterized protein n=1 Tax=Thelohanellus kitauei TaxID=669202 RepID=A0A0C2JM76_THEKT|nr:hypothetical protein RF11_08336 [Thelohanellus kitauei]
MHPSLNTLDDYLLTFDGQNGDSVYRLSGYDPTFSLFFEVLGKTLRYLCPYQILPSSALPNISPDTPQLMGLVDVSQKNDPFCAVIIDENKRHVLNVEGTRRSEVYSYFEFRISSTPKTRIQDGYGGYRERKLSGYMMRCPSTHRGSSSPKVTVILEEFCDCVVNVYLTQIVEEGPARFAQASYRQVEQAVSDDGKKRLSGKIALPNLLLKRYSPAIVCHSEYLHLLRATPDPERHCSFENWRLAIKEQFYGTQRISLITRSERIHQQTGSVVVSERPSQELLKACHAVVGNGVKPTA